MSRNLSPSLPTAVPAPPRNLTVSEVTRSGCRLTWQAPADDGGSPVTGYIVEKRSAAYSPRWTKITRKPIDARDIDLEDFAMDEEVEFRVLAVNAAGYGQPCDATDVITIKDPFGTYCGGVSSLSVCLSVFLSFPCCLSLASSLFLSLEV